MKFDHVRHICSNIFCYVCLHEIVISQQLLVVSLEKYKKKNHNIHKHLGVSVLQKESAVGYYNGINEWGRNITQNIYKISNVKGSDTIVAEVVAAFDWVVIMALCPGQNSSVLS